MIKRITGTKDILPDEIRLWQEIETISRRIFSYYNYQEIRPPLVEDVSLFNRSLGETTEIIQKQMFLIPHQDQTYALRPEGTASIVRAYIENNLDKTNAFSKLYYLGPMFRLERPQKGRLRQFHHVGCEAIGCADPSIDVEIIGLADTLLNAFAVNDFCIKLNSLGCPEDRKELKTSLQKKLKDKYNHLCPECQARFNNNVLRILDCKNTSCQEIVKDCAVGSSHLCDACQNHFNAVKEGLRRIGITFTLTEHLVRGLDYYTGTVFEISHSSLGAQDAIGAGGRYDTLVQELGGPSIGAVGFALGIERILLATKITLQDIAKDLVYLIPLGTNAKEKVLELLHHLRKEGIRTETDYEGKSLKGAMRAANEQNARFVLIIGDDELQKESVTIKDMQSSIQDEIKLSDCTEELKKRIA